MSNIQTKAQQYLEILLATEIRVDLMTLFHKNPGIIDTSEGIARRIGLLKETVQPELEEIAKLGVIGKKKFGQQEVYFLNQARDAEIQQSIGEYLQSVRITR